MRVARRDEQSLLLIIEDEVKKLLQRIAEKQGWAEWPSNQVRN